MGMVGRVMTAMIDYYAGDVRRINHFLKVYGFARGIGEMEGLDGQVLATLEIAALMHDIGIRKSMELYGNAGGKNQEKEGPPESCRMLEQLGCDAATIDRVCWLVGHHHTYDPIEGIDHQILVEADFLVNIFEGNLHGPGTSVPHVRRQIFRTAAGLHYLDALYGREADMAE